MRYIETLPLTSITRSNLPLSSITQTSCFRQTPAVFVHSFSTSAVLDNSLSTSAVLDDSLNNSADISISYSVLMCPAQHLLTHSNTLLRSAVTTQRSVRHHRVARLVRPHYNNTTYLSYYNKVLLLVSQQFVLQTILDKRHWRLLEFSFAYHLLGRFRGCISFFPPLA